MADALLITIHLLDDRYHGAGRFPPGPARLFQALVAGAGLSGPLSDPDTKALEWLEALPPPVIGVPRVLETRSYRNYVPNNDMDAPKVKGEASKIRLIRTPKMISAKILYENDPFLYAWAYPENPESDMYGRHVCRLAGLLYQFGRGVDMAFATGELLKQDAMALRLHRYGGVIYNPGVGGENLFCPQRGSLASLKRRQDDRGQRFRRENMRRTCRVAFVQPEKPQFRPVGYNSPTERRVFVLASLSKTGFMYSFPLEKAVRLVLQLRDNAAQRLNKAAADSCDIIERVFVGRKSDGSNNFPSTRRIRIVPLPSIGHYNADMLIRRVLVEVPATCPLQAEDVFWAFTGMDVINESGVREAYLDTASDQNFLRHYGVYGSYVRWRSVTPVALPWQVARRSGRKSVIIRRKEQARAAGALIQALRHAGIRTRPHEIRLQQEPFSIHGIPVANLMGDVRFAPPRLWNVEITFDEDISGPLIIGDGRFLGLGVMAPVTEFSG